MKEKPGCLDTTIGKIGTIGAVLTLLIALIPIVQAMWDSRQQGQVDATAIAIQAAQLDIMIEQATLEARQSDGFDNDATATIIAERLIDLQGTSVALEILELEGTIVALEQRQELQTQVIPSAIAATPLPITPTRLMLPNTATPQPLTNLYEIVVQGDKEKNQTGIIISAGDFLSIQFSEGMWRAGPLPTWPFHGPNGDPQVALKETFPVQNRPIMALVGGIGDQKPFWVGTSLQFESSISGELWLGANDDNFSDNYGQLTVFVEINR